MAQTQISSRKCMDENFINTGVYTPSFPQQPYDGSSSATLHKQLSEGWRICKTDLSNFSTLLLPLNECSIIIIICLAITLMYGHNRCLSHLSPPTWTSSKSSHCPSTSLVIAPTDVWMEPPQAWWLHYTVSCFHPQNLSKRQHFKSQVGSN